MAFSIHPGVWPTMITPFTEDNKPDFKAIEKLTDWYIEKGCAGIFAVCQSSEMAYLSEQEKLDIAKCVAETVEGSRSWPPATRLTPRPISSSRSKT